MQTISFQKEFLAAFADLDWTSAEAQRGNSEYHWLATAGGKTAEVCGQQLGYDSVVLLSYRKEGGKFKYGAWKQENARVELQFFPTGGREFDFNWGIGPITCPQCHAKIQGTVHVAFEKVTERDFVERLRGWVPPKYAWTESGATYYFWEKQSDRGAFGVGQFLKEEALTYIKGAAMKLADREFASAMEYEAALNEALREDDAYLEFVEAGTRCGFVVGAIKLIHYIPIPPSSGLPAQS